MNMLTSVWLDLTKHFKWECVMVLKIQAKHLFSQSQKGFGYSHYVQIKHLKHPHG